MYYYFNWPKMSGREAFVGEGAAGILHSAELGSGGGGCGVLAGYDGTCAAVASATIAAQGLSSKRGACVAKMHGDWNDTASTKADLIWQDNTGMDNHNKTTNTSNESECEYSAQCMLGNTSDVNGEGVHLKEASSINIDHKPSGPQHGGGHSDFMDVASRRIERTADRLQLASTDTQGRINREPISSENEESLVTKTARNGNTDMALPKRRGCRLSGTPKRVCFDGTTAVVHCGISHSGARGSGPTCAPLRNTRGNGLLLLKSYNHTQTQKPRHRLHPTEDRTMRQNRRQFLTGCGISGYPVKHALICRSTATGNGCVNACGSSDGRSLRTSKGRVRLYRVRSFLEPTSGHSNGGSEGVNLKGIRYCPENGNNANHALQQTCPTAANACLSKGQEQASVWQDSDGEAYSVFTRTAAGRKESEGLGKRSIKKIIGAPKECAVAQNGVELNQNGISRDPCSRAYRDQIETEGSGEEAAYKETPQMEVLEAGAGNARRRQGPLRERTERLWRRLQVVQVKQLERHIVEQLKGLVGVVGRRRDSGQVCLPPPSSGELSRLARSCREALRATEAALDSDHTASSSGGESEGEGEEREGDRTQTVKNKRQEWQWAEQRAGLGSRWAWLQAHVSELEYRIRGLTELYNRLRRSKDRGVHQPSGSLPSPETPQQTPQPSRPNSPLCRTRAMEEVGPPGSPVSAARARPLPRQRRHRLLHLEDAAGAAAKPVSVQCWCQHPTVCVLCAANPSGSSVSCAANPSRSGPGRTSLWAQPTSLDLCLHPVLSFPSDISLDLQCGGISRAGLRSHSAMRPTAGVPPPAPWLARRGQGSQRLGRLKRGVQCTRPVYSRHNADGPSERAPRSLDITAFYSHHAPSTDLLFRPTTPPVPDTPVQPLRRRRGGSSSDIDNLVMPLGLAGLGGGAKVQRLQYKEILTPSWRELGSQPSAPAGWKGPNSGPPGARPGEDRTATVEDEKQEEEEVEDLSDTAFLSRHAQWECREKGRWGRWVHRRRRGRVSYRGEGKLGTRTLERAPPVEPRIGLLAESESWPPSPPEAPGVVDSWALVQEHSAVLPWERRSFPLSEVELQWLLEDEEVDHQGAPDVERVAPSTHSQSTDSGISLELLPFTPRPSSQPVESVPRPPLAPVASITQGTLPPFVQNLPAHPSRHGQSPG